MSNKSVFLDNASGDLYLYNRITNHWDPIANAGMHYDQLLQNENILLNQQSIKNIKKIIEYVPKKNFDLPPKPYVSRNDEYLMKIYKQKLTHWALEGLDKSNVLIQCKNRWWVHPFNITNADRQLKTLTECDKGPLIIE